MSKRSDYATLLREAMMSPKRNKQRREINIRDLEQQVMSPDGTRWVYEHFRKVLRGRPVMSRQLNAALCAYVGLDPEEMWNVAEHEKALRRIDTMKVRPQVVPDDERLKRVWKKLSMADQKRALVFMEGLAATRNVN